jgi:opacity protein-like surface antigen
MPRLAPRLALLAALAATPAFAQMQTPSSTMPPAAPSFYIVGSLGYAQHDIDEDAFGRRVSGIANVSSSVDDGDFAWKVAGGWQALPWLGVEVSYFDLGRSTVSLSAPVFSAGADAKVDVTGWAVDLVPMVHFQGTPWSVFGRVGYVRSETKSRLSTNGPFLDASAQGKQNSNGWDAGLGASYAFSRNFEVRGEWTYFVNLGGDDVGGEFDANAFLVSAVWRFQ